LIASAIEGFVGVERIGRVPRLGSCPYRALKGEHPNDEWYEELYQNLACDSQDFHCFGEL
jgi:hypothetical protein